MSKKKELNVKQRQVEQRLSEIGAEVADAEELAQTISCLSDKTDDILKEAQQGLEELYLSLEEDAQGVNADA